MTEIYRSSIIFLYIHVDAVGGTFDPVGFSAFADYSDYYYPFQRINFHGVISNIGNYYNEIESWFICPKNGVYFFSLAIKSDDNYQSDYCIMQDDTRVATVAVDSNLHFPSSATFVVVECSYGQEMWVRAGNVSSYIIGTEVRESIFSGYMLYPYE